MALELAMVATFMVFSALGAVTRTLFGIYKAYTSTVFFKLDYKRVMIEIIASVFFGTFSSVLLLELGGLKVSMEAVALIAGFFGADLITLLSKKIGLTKSIEVKLTEQQVEHAELNDRQVAALQYLKTHKRITNEVYQKLTGAKRTTAKYDLSQLVKAGKIKKKGEGKSTYYTAA